MKQLVWIAILFTLASCNQTGSAVTRDLKPSEKAESKSNEPLQVHPVTQDKEYIEDQKKAKSTKVEAPTVSKSTTIDPAMLGDYTFVISPEQQKQIDASMAKMEKDVAAGNSQAASAMAMAKQAIEVAKNMVVTLNGNRRYDADFGSGAAGGKFEVNGTKVLLTPDVPSTRPGDPKDVELVFDKAAQTLTANFQGEKMVFKKKR